MAKHKQLRVKKWLSTGELVAELKTQGSILEACGRLLDTSCSHEILGEVLFQATDGKYYVITTEAVIGKANPEYVKDCLQRIKEEE
jgi:hypothetical protein